MILVFSVILSYKQQDISYNIYRLINKSDNSVVMATIIMLYIRLLWFIIFQRQKKLYIFQPYLKVFFEKKKYFILYLKLSLGEGRSRVCLRSNVIQCLQRRIIRNTDNTRQNCSFRVSVSITFVSFGPLFFIMLMPCIFYITIIWKALLVPTKFTVLLAIVL